MRYAVFVIALAFPSFGNADGWFGPSDEEKQASLELYMHDYSSTPDGDCDSALRRVVENVAKTNGTSYSSAGVALRFFKEDVLRDVADYSDKKANDAPFRTTDKLRAYRSAGDAALVCGGDADSVLLTVLMLMQ